MKRLWTIAVLCGLMQTVAVAEEPFVSVPLDKALKQAAAEGKLVFVDFYATWCMPCKMMEATTFKNGKVVKLLSSKYIALKIDAEKEAKLAEQYRITGYPSLVFLKPDGSVAEFVTTYVDGASFLRLATDVLEGRDSLTLLRAQYKESPDDPVVRSMLAETLLTRGRTTEALAEGRFVLEKAELDLVSAEVVPSLVAQYLTYAQNGPEIQKELDRLYQAAKTALDASKATNAQMALYSAYHLLNGKTDELLATYDRLAPPGDKSEFVRRLTILWKTSLVAVGRHDDIASRIDVPKVAAETLAKLPACKPGAPGDPVVLFDPATLLKQHTLMSVMDYYRVLLAQKRPTDAAHLADLMGKAEDSAGMYNALAWTAYEADAANEATLALARRAHELAGGKDSSVVDTLARVLHRMGKTDEAVRVVNDALKWASPGPETMMLQQCLTDFAEK